MVVWAMGALLYEELWACGYFFCSYLMTSKRAMLAR